MQAVSGAQFLNIACLFLSSTCLVEACAFALAPSPASATVTVPSQACIHYCNHKDLASTL